MLVFSLGTQVSARTNEAYDSDIIAYYEANNEYFDISHQGRDMVITITDRKFKKLLDAKGIDSSFISNHYAEKSSNGVTKIVWPTPKKMVISIFT